MIIDIKKLNEKAKIPKIASPGDAGLDLVAISKNSNKGFVEFGTGLVISIPEGFAGFIFPRSSISKTNLMLCNSVGVIDSSYRGELKIRFDHRDHDSMYTETYNVGDKVAQLIILPYPEIQFNEVDNLDDTVRGSGGFGSTDLEFGNITPITKFNLSEL